MKPEKNGENKLGLGRECEEEDQQRVHTVVSGNSDEGMKLFKPTSFYSSSVKVWAGSGPTRKQIIGPRLSRRIGTSILEVHFFSVAMILLTVFSLSRYLLILLCSLPSLTTILINLERKKKKKNNINHSKIH